MLETIMGKEFAQFVGRFAIRRTIAIATSLDTIRFRRFVNFKLRHQDKIKIIVAETYSKSATYDGTTCSGIRATGEGQVYGLFHLLPSLVQAYGHERLELEFSNKPEKDNIISANKYKSEVEKHHLVIIGGPIHNNWARAVMEHDNPQFNYGCLIPGASDPHVLYNMDTREPAYKQTKDCDYGLIIQTKSETKSGNNVLLLSGNTTKGTAAAAMAVSNSAHLKIIRNKIEHSSIGRHSKDGGCFFFKSLGEDMNGLRPDLVNSNWGKMKLKY